MTKLVTNIKNRRSRGRRVAVAVGVGLTFLVPGLPLLLLWRVRQRERAQRLARAARPAPVTRQYSAA